MKYAKKHIFIGVNKLSLVLFLCILVSNIFASDTNNSNYNTDTQNHFSSNSKALNSKPFCWVFEPTSLASPKKEFPQAEPRDS